MPGVAAATSCATDGFLSVDGRRIEYRRVGPIESVLAPIVLLHEGLGCVALWKSFPEALSEATGRVVVAYSRFGYGRSSAAVLPRTADYMHEEAGTWLPQVLAALGIHRPVLFGHSDGASIALLHAAGGADLAGLIVLAPHVRVEPVTVLGIEAARAAYESGDLRARLARLHDDVEQTFRGWNDVWLSARFRSWNIEATLAGIHVPVLAIQGAQDEYGTFDQLVRIAARVSSVECHELAQCRHSPHRDQLTAVLRLAADYLARCR